VKCPVCHFENMPGLTRCARCQAMLVVTESVAGDDLAPPRAGRWKRLRLGFYTLRRWGLWPQARGAKSRRRKRPKRVAIRRPSRVLRAVIWGTIPGGGFWFRKERRTALDVFLGWLVLLTASAMFAGDSVGAMLITLTMAWHFATTMAPAFLATGESRSDSTTSRFWGLAALYAAMNIGTLYSLGWMGVRLFVGFYHTTMASPALDVRVGDILLIRRRQPPRLKIGDIVLVRFSTGYYPYLGQYRVNSRQSPGLVVGLPGDKLEVRNGGLLRNGQPVNSLPTTFDGAVRYTPAWGRAVVAVPFEGYRDNRRVGGRGIEYGISSVDVSAIEGRAVMVYQPLSRRHLLRQATQPKSGK